MANDKYIYIIAEIGINHNGSLDLAKQLIDLAVRSGCDVVKFQKRNIEIVYGDSVLSQPRKSPWGTTQREQKEALEFSWKNMMKLILIVNQGLLIGSHHLGMKIVKSSNEKI